MKTSAFALLFLSLFSSAVLPSVSAQFYTFCISLSSNLSTSPIFPFSIALSGTFNFSTSQGLVLSATGQRVVSYHGVTYTSPFSLAAVSSYQSNDNILSLSPPYLTSSHGLAFVHSTPVYSAYGPSSSLYSFLYNDTTYGLAEDSTPPSDGILASITSSFTLSPSTIYTSSIPCTLPSVPSPSPSTSLVLSSTVSYNFCYQFTGGPGDVTDAGGIWTIQTSGQLITSAYSVPMTSSNASVILNLTATRTYTDSNGQSQTVIITGLAPVNPLHGAYATNILYSTYPYLDIGGLYFTTSSPLTSPLLPSASSTLGQLWIDSYEMFDELIIELTTGRTYESPVGAFDLALTSAGSSSLQCAYTAGTVRTFKYCYSLQSSSPFPFLLQTYGLFQATGPTLRQGRPAYTLQSMTGVRTLTTSTMSAVQNVVRLVYINGDAEVSDGNILNDNLLYVNLPYIDGYGFDFALSSNIIYPDHVANTTDINLSEGNGIGSPDWYEWPAVGDGVQSTDSVLNYTLYDPTVTTFPCVAAAAPASSSVNFCYTAQSDTESVMAQGTLWLYGSLMEVGGRAAHALQSASGTRLYQNSNGVVNSVAITGVSADSFGALNFTYNQILYQSTPYVDSEGLLFTLAAGAVTPEGGIAGDQVVNVALVNGSVVEQWESMVGMHSTVVSFTVSSSALSCSVSGFGGGSSGLSGGQIAGIVIGSVLGAALMVVLVCFVMRLTAGKGNMQLNSPVSTSRPSFYDVQRDASFKPAINTEGGSVQIA